MTADRDEGYNGWTNYETWNVALWIGGDEGLYNMAKEYRGRGYAAFAFALRELDTTETPDGIAWNDSGLDISELDMMMSEL